VLDDRDGRVVERGREAEGGVEIEVVDVRQRLALELFGRRDPAGRPCIERSGLMRVLAVPEVLHLRPISAITAG
jgi:hypothetical protein